MSCIDCASPTAQPLQSTEYTVTVTDENGCSVTGRISVLVESGIFIPTIFRPGSQHDNDKFLVTSTVGKVITEMKIFDRWGNMVYFQDNYISNDASYSWDGTFNGKRSESGVYTGYLKFRNLAGKEVMISFNITMIH